MGPQAHFENRLEMWFLQDSRRVESWSVQDDRHGPVVDEGDGHPRPEAALFHMHARIGEGCAEALVERLRLVRRGGEREARSVALARIRDQRELAHDERGAADVEETPIELAGIVLEDSESRDLRSEERRVGKECVSRGWRGHR